MLIDKFPYRILIVEDNHGDFALVEDYLLENIVNPLIFKAESFKEASLKLRVKNTFFDVILLDLTLPDKSGEELINNLLKISSDCPIIVLTGYTDIDFSIKSISLGVADYLLKDDLDGASLYKSIIYCIERRKKIKEITESEKRYSDLFHLSPLPMWVYDIDTLIFLDVNKAAIDHYGYTQEEFLNITLNNIRLEEDLEELKATIKQLKENIDKTIRGSLRHTKKNGDIILVDIQTNVIFYKEKQARISIINDITERSLYIKTIEKQNEKLKDIAWTQSHLVRAPLARILGLADLLQNYKEEKEDERKELLKYLVLSANELDHMIRDISDKIHDTKSDI